MNYIAYKTIISAQQYKRLIKLNTDKFYLIKSILKDDIYTLKISGSTGNIYSVNVQQKSIECDCTDYLIHCRNTDLICKHICFVVHRICKILNTKIYERRYFNKKEFNIFKNSIKNVWHDNDIVNDMYVKKYDQFNKLNDNSFNAIDARNLEDDCPICFIPLRESLISDIAKCPECINPLHVDCINEWNKRNPTCVFCRSDVWTNYGNTDNLENE